MQQKINVGGRIGEKPLMIYDGECGLCGVWIERWTQSTGDSVEYAPSQTNAGRFPEIPADTFEKAVVLILPGGEVFTGAGAVLRAIREVPGRGWLFWAYRRVPGTKALTEFTYGVVAKNRGFFLALTKLFWGKKTAKPEYVLTRWLFLRLLGVVYLFAFLSFWFQIDGLIGEGGVLPAKNFLEAVRANLGSSGYWQVPTLAWFGAGDGVLNFIAAGGAALALLLIFNAFAAPVLIALWAFYLSLVSVGQVFMSYQWDIFLLEVGFLAIFLSIPSDTVIWLFRWLMFRFMFLSGVVKLLSGDEAWRNLTALNYHYWTQPLPHPISWYADKLPEQFDKLSVGAMFFIELVVPFFVFLPRRFRILAASSVVSLEGLIFLTGNYNFFNLLVMTLALLLLDDFAVSRIVPASTAEKIRNAFRWKKTGRIKKGLASALAAFVLLMSLPQLALVFGFHPPEAILRPISFVSPFYTVNNYGLFAVMTKTRPEIVIEGSKDGESWAEYEFIYKPGRLDKAPKWVAPHQPRLDWQMWFSGLYAERAMSAGPDERGVYSYEPWFINFVTRILEGSPEVLSLIERNPFPEGPPQSVRALVYDYKFTDFEEKRPSGNWWKRELVGEYLPPVSLE